MCLRILIFCHILVVIDVDDFISSVQNISEDWRRHTHRLILHVIVHRRRKWNQYGITVDTCRAAHCEISAILQLL
jgi:hypothetical protein